MIFLRRCDFSNMADLTWRLTGQSPKIATEFHPVFYFSKIHNIPQMMDAIIKNLGFIQFLLSTTFQSNVTII